MFDIHTVDLEKFNTLFKYPSILTYHKMGEKGRLQEELAVPLMDYIQANGPLHVTEKIDGTNVRIIFCPDGSLLLGSRENLLWNRGELFYDTAMDIVRVMKPWVSELTMSDDSAFVALYGEFYGGKVGKAAPNYGTESNDFRVFDSFAIGTSRVERILEEPIEKIAEWRDSGGQPFDHITNMQSRAKLFGFKSVPYLEVVSELPTDIRETNKWLLEKFVHSHAKISLSARDMSEGVVIRTANRAAIAKLRFEDYGRTLRSSNNNVVF